jgi:hypothetical protein
LRVSAIASDEEDHVLMVGKAASQLGPMSDRDGNGTVCPMWALATTAPESNG